MKTLEKMYEHLNWANQQIAGTLRSLEGEKKEEIRLFSHILFAERVWITRLQGLDSSRLPIWSEVDMKVCEKLVTQNQESIRMFFSNLTNHDLERLVFYKNSKGQEFKNSIRDILTHIALHGQYHRGQINFLLRRDGFEPINIDFITFVR